MQCFQAFYYFNNFFKLIKVVIELEIIIFIIHQVIMLLKEFLNIYQMALASPYELTPALYFRMHKIFVFVYIYIHTHIS